MCLMRVRDDGRPFVHASAAWPRCPLPLPLLLPSPFDTAFVSEAVVSAAATAAATIAPKTSLLLPMNCPPQVAVPQGRRGGYETENLRAATARAAAQPRRTAHPRP